MSEEISHTEEIAQVEHRLKEAIARDLELIHDEKYLVINYLVIAEVLGEDSSRAETLYTHGNNSTFTSLLGWMDYVRILLTERLHRQIARNRRED